MYFVIENRVLKIHIMFLGEKRLKFGFFLWSKILELNF
jgi:hypothetical protein